MLHNYTKKELMTLITGKLRRNFGRDVEEATSQHMFKACAMVLRDIMSERQMKSADKVVAEHQRQVHYLSLEFLMGRSLMKNAYNLGVVEPLKQAIEGLGFSAADLFEAEPDAGLGNGGLGRLAACYLDSMTTLEIPATGYSICYELGIFKQKIVDGQQVELPDNWLGLGDAWLIPKMDEVEEVRFGGTVEDDWDSQGRHQIKHTGYDTVLAVPRDMEIAGYKTEHGNTLRLWDAKSPTPVDMSLFSSGQYLKAVEQKAMAESISKVLYPEDNHYEGKSLRLKQQYFFVSATIQSIVRKHRAEYGTLRNFHLKHVIQINDTHPTLAIPELMRILLDEEGYGWDEAWYITTHTIAYTNHTVMAEALERWPQQLIERWLPRIWQILKEISGRYQDALTTYFHGDLSKVAPMAIIWGGEVRMANLCVCACFKVNGVSALHSEILKKDVFHDAYVRTPDKFTNVTNGIDHRRWLSESNPALDALIQECCGKDKYLLKPEALKELEKFQDDAGVLTRLGEIKAANKKAFAAWVQRESGIVLNTDAMFDVQVKRLHVQAPAAQRAAHHLPVPEAEGGSPLRLHPPHLPVRRQGGPRLRGGQADHPSHQLRGRHDRQGSHLQGSAAGGVPGELPGEPGGKAHARQRALRADLHRRQGGQRHRQHEVHDERRGDHRHPGRRQRGDAPGAGRREHLPLRPEGP